MKKTQDNKTQDARQDEDVRKAALGLLNGFSNVASVFLAADDSDLAPLFAKAVAEDPA